MKQEGGLARRRLRPRPKEPRIADEGAIRLYSDATALV
jgi:hypothetical protein